MASLERVYADQMRHHPYGYALYHPASTTTLRPGSVGVFDGLGFWNPIAHLEDPTSLQKHGLKPPTEGLERAPSERIRKWSPRTSSGVSEKLLGFRIGAGALAAGLPVDANLAVEYQSAVSYGAVLISSSPVTREAFYYQAPFKKWVKENAAALLHGHLAEDIKQHGLFVVTQTFATKKCALTAWRHSERKVHFGFGAGISGLAELSPEVDWYAGSSETGWNFHEAEGSESKVVFAGGLSFHKVLGSESRLRESKSPTRGAFDIRESIPVILPDEKCALSCEVWGDLDRHSDLENEDDDDIDGELEGDEG
ncbi:MAG: hypothetical protein Q9191_006776 [Dirinaria sp. TL-2023a]